MLHSAERSAVIANGTDIIYTEHAENADGSAKIIYIIYTAE